MDELVFWLYFLPGWWNLGGFVGYMLIAHPFTAKDIVVDCLQELISCPERCRPCVAKAERLTIPLTTISTMKNTILFTRDLSAICDAITGLLKERNEFDNR